MSEIETINIKTSNYFEMIDITSDIKRSVSKSKVDSGIVAVYTPHTTAGVTINENADPSVRSDIVKFFSLNYIKESYFRHFEGNSPSHILSSLISASITLIVDKGEVLLGTWQGIYFCEFDGPRNRKVLIKIIEDN